MMSTRISLHDDLLRSAFQRFDVDNSGFVTKKKPLEEDVRFTWECYMNRDKLL